MTPDEMPHRAALRFAYAPSIAAAVARALSPESQQAEVPKTRGRVAHAAGELRIEIEATDLPSLRASVNSHLRWVEAAARSAKLGQ